MWKKFLFWKLPPSHNPPLYSGDLIAMEGFADASQKVEDLHLRLAASPEPWSSDFDRREVPPPPANVYRHADEHRDTSHLPWVLAPDRRRP